MKHTSLIPWLVVIMTACSGPSSGPGLPRITHFTATPNTRADPGPVTLAWEVQDATSLDIDGGVGHVTPLMSGRVSVPLDATTTFTLTARNAAGRATAQVTARLNAAPFSLAIDPGLVPFESTVLERDGSHPVAAVRDAAGVTSTFVEDEVVVVADSQAQLDSFLTRHAGTLLSSHQDADGLNALIRVEPRAFDAGGFAADATELGVPGQNTFSSVSGSQLHALIAHEERGGLRASANYLGQPQGVLLNALEGGNDDALARAEFTNSGSRPQVKEAWQFVAAHSLNAGNRRVRVAIIDGGFVLDTQGNTPADANGARDFPLHPIQRDFVDDTDNADGANPATCSGGTACPYHGNGSASVAAGVLGNGAFAAGTGGQVADPLLARTNLSTYQVKHAIDWANGQRAGVINMSFGSSCGYWCRRGQGIAGYYKAFDRARDAGIVLVASAGNGDSAGVGLEVDGADYEPCRLGGVLCVGALNDSTNTAKTYSNYGSPVGLWAPTDVRAAPDPTSAGKATTHTGTSAAAPYVAGVAAMLRAVNPALSGDQVRAILQSTAWTDSPDPHVTRSLNAFAAVRTAAGFQLPPDRFEPNDAAGAPTTIQAGQYDDLNLQSSSDVDRYRFTTDAPSVATFNLTDADGVGKVAFQSGLSTSQECGVLTQQQDATTPNHRQLAFRLPAGEYAYTLAGGRPLPYDLGLQLVASPLLPDRYEPNDTLAEASPLSGGYVNATLHTAGDVDYYQFRSQGSSSTPVRLAFSLAALFAADHPLTLRAYDRAGTLLGTASSAADCSHLASFPTLPAGLITVEVSGDAPGAYTLFLGSVSHSNPLQNNEQLVYLSLHPGVPVEVSLLHPEEDFVIDRSSAQGNDPGLTRLDVRGADLHLHLYTEAGQSLGEGVAQGGTEDPGEVITLPTPSFDLHTVLRIDRVGTAAAPAAGGAHVAIPATIRVLTAGQ